MQTQSPEIPEPASTITNASRIVFVVDQAQQACQAEIENWAGEWVSASGREIPFSCIFLPVYTRRKAKPETSSSALEAADGDSILVPLKAIRKKHISSPHGVTAYLQNRLKGFFLTEKFIRHPHNWQAPDREVLVGESASLAQLQKDFSLQESRTSKPVSFQTFVASRARFTLDLAERRVRGRRYKVPGQIAENLKHRPQLAKAIHKLAVDTGEQERTLWSRVDDILGELVAKPNPAWIDIAAKLTGKIISAGYEPEIVVAKNDLDKISAIVENYPTAFLWTHKSHMDGFVMQHVFYANDLPPAHTFGGINMAFAGVGSAARRAGVIFIRRSFQDDPLYKLLLQHYIAYLLEKRFPFSWAFEGTRSRTGKLMPPKYGLLKYLLDACYETKTPNLHIIPVALNYDLIGDVSDYAQEQSGASKTAESLSWFVKYLRKMSRPMGRIFMNIGEPIVVAEPVDPEDFESVSKIAFQVGVEVNRRSPITLPSLTVMSLLLTYPKAQSSAELSGNISALLDWARQRNIELTSDFQARTPEHAESILKVMLDNKLVSLYEDETIQLFSIHPEQDINACYYRNTIVHHFIVKAFSEVALLACGNELENAPQRFWKETETLRNLFKFEFFYPSKNEFESMIRSELIKYDAQWEDALGTRPNYAKSLLEQFKPLVAPAVLRQFAESYWIAASVLCQTPADQRLEEKVFIKRCLNFGEQAYLQNQIMSRASIAKQLFNNGFSLAKNAGVMDENKSSIAADREALKGQFRRLMNQLDKLRIQALPLD